MDIHALYYIPPVNNHNAGFEVDNAIFQEGNEMFEGENAISQVANAFLKQTSGGLVKAQEWWLKADK